MVMPPSPGIPTGRGNGLKHRPVWVRIPPGAHNHWVGISKIHTATALGVALVLGLAGCTSSPTVSETSDLGNHFETSNPEDKLFDDGSGNELEVGSDLSLPPDWPEGVPTPAGALISVSVIDDRTAVATWSVEGDVFQAQQSFLAEFNSGFSVEPIPDLSTDTIIVYGATGNGFDITISSTLGERSTDPGEITLLVNPSS